MRSPPDLSHQRVIRALEKAGFVVKRQGKHVFMFSEERQVVAVVPRHNPVKRRTLLRLLASAKLPLEEFLDLL